MADAGWSNYNGSNAIPENRSAAEKPKSLLRVLLFGNKVTVIVLRMAVQHFVSTSSKLADRLFQ